jgi:hypothetical protein
MKTKQIKQIFFARQKEWERIYLDLEEFSKGAPDVHLINFYINEKGESTTNFHEQLFSINIWQNCGSVNDLLNKKPHLTRFGLRGTKGSFFVGIYGKDTDKFKSFVMRAGNLINMKDYNPLFFHLFNKFQKVDGGKSVVNLNPNPVAVWLGIMNNFVPFYDKKAVAIGHLALDPISLFLYILNCWGVNPHKKHLRWYEHFITWYGILGTTLGIITLWLFGWQTWGWWFFWLTYIK